MEFGILEIYDFSGFRFYYGLSDRAHILVETETSVIDLISLNRYAIEKIQALIRLSSPKINYIHDNLEVRLDKRKVEEIIAKYPDYGWALRDQLEKMSLYASNLRFHLDALLHKISEILGDYSGTRYHSTKEEKKHFVRRIISNFDKYILLDEIPLNWVNFIDCLAQIKTDKQILVINTWRSFLIIQNYAGSDYQRMYYNYSNTLLNEFLQHKEVEVINLDERNIDQILNLDLCRVHGSAITTANPIRYL